MAKEKDKTKDYLLYRVALCWADEWWSAGDKPTAWNGIGIGTGIGIGNVIGTTI